MDPDVFVDPLFGQEPEVRLLAALRPALREPAAVDVGAERGDVAAALLEAGFSPLTMIEASPRCAEALRRRFGEDESVSLLPLAAAERDGTVQIHEASTDSGERAPQFDSVVAGAADPDEREHVFSEPIEVEARSLASLAAEGAVPREPGLLKIDVEGLEASVLRGAAGIRPEIVMVEHWTDLPGSHGPCPWSFGELRELASGLGLERWVSFAHGEIHTRVEAGVEGPEIGEWANVVFFAPHLAGAVEAALPGIRGYLEERLLAKADAYREAAEERLVLVRELEVAAAERLERLKRATAEVERLRELLPRRRR